MFTKFAKNKAASDLLAEGMAERLSKKAYNPFEEEYMDPEIASDEIGANDARHFHGRNDLDDSGEGVWGRDLDEEDLAGMGVEGPTDNEQKLQNVLDALRELEVPDDKLDEISDLLVSVDDESSTSMKEDGMESEGLSMDDLPLSTSSKKFNKVASLPSLPGEESASLKRLVGILKK